MCVQRETAYAYIREHCTYMRTSYFAAKANISTSLKQKCRRFDEIFITGQNVVKMITFGAVSD